jgi:hypothetical protein
MDSSLRDLRETNLLYNYEHISPNWRKSCAVRFSEADLCQFNKNAPVRFLKIIRFFLPRF